ncbi:polysaccharide biosynthesis/export family protein [Algoriphagus sp. NG3]|uniref:polysaccharide biosynthesis/export family protein n=1 Tax=Algoriphagus sp. NG3 TaxID=3097546 RepID=UPI002A7FFAA0|nr:polysaccharide biosynthesis/export family protein [Algoriphagus sp. NG3]WPR77816.1 polysaccharide biosynthesis/export family protein [Algoriphagus sp. NG3]
MKQKSNKFLAILISMMSLFSCISNEKIIYMQDAGSDSNPVISSSERIGYHFDDYLLQQFDIVDINIKTTSEDLNQIFNATSMVHQNNGMMAGGSQAGGDVFFMNGYTIDKEGIVELPLIGELRLVGLTTKEAQGRIAEEVRKYVNEDEFYTRVRLGGIRFSALGEFNAPGKLTILQNRVTIFEAIAAANDLNILAKRDELVIIRQYPDGSQIHKVNLNDKNLLASDFYFIKPNDVLYAEPLKVREVGGATNFLQTITLLTSTVTAIALILTLVNN